MVAPASPVPVVTVVTAQPVPVLVVQVLVSMGLVESRRRTGVRILPRERWDDFDPADRPPEALIAEAERVILELADQVVAEARRAGLVGPDVTGADYLFGLLMVTRSPECALLGHGPDQRGWLLDTYLRGLRP